MDGKHATQQRIVYTTQTIPLWKQAKSFAWSDIACKWMIHDWSDLHQQFFDVQKTIKLANPFAYKKILFLIVLFAQFLIKIYKNMEEIDIDPVEID